MFDQKKVLRALAAVACLAILTVTLMVVTMPEAEAADCGGWAGGMSHDWVNTPAAQTLTNNGHCGPDAICQEWCMISCGDEVPQGIFECFPS